MLPDQPDQTAVPDPSADMSDYGVSGAIMVVTQSLKPCFGDSFTRFVPILPLALAVLWCWADERANGPVVNWAVIVSRSVKIFIMSVGMYAAGKQVVKKTGA